MRLAYADPPYLGCARRYREHPDAARWDDAAEHGRLMATMDEGWDGWALSCSAKSLPDLLPLAPGPVRVGAWAKPFSAFKKHVRIAYTWEPLIFRPARPNNDPAAPCTRDSLTVPMTTRRGVVGAKPPAFCRWVLDLLGYLDGDTVDDLFPGSGVMATVVAQGTIPVTGVMS
jgi:DNA modification methylase